MDDALMPFLWLALTLPILLLLQRWIHRHIRGVAYLITGRMSWAVLIYAIILFPGVLLHELSHLITARLLGVRTGSISLLPQVQSDGAIRLGYVEYYKGRTLGPIRESLIGGAPLFTGTVTVLLIGLHVFDVGNLTGALQSGSVEQLTTALSRIFTTPDFLVWLYLIFAVSNAMMPSPSDRRAWPAFILLLALSALIIYGLDLSHLVLDGLRGPLSTLFGYLGLAFSLAIGVDVVFIFLLYMLEGIVSRVKGVELVYEAAEREHGS